MPSFTSKQRRKHIAQDTLMEGIMVRIRATEMEKVEGRNEDVEEVTELIADMKIEATKLAKRMGYDCWPGLFERNI